MCYLDHETYFPAYEALEDEKLQKEEGNNGESCQAESPASATSFK